MTKQEAEQLLFEMDRGLIIVNESDRAALLEKIHEALKVVEEQPDEPEIVEPESEEVPPESEEVPPESEEVPPESEEVPPESASL
jgi:hypothetical protein